MASTVSQTPIANLNTPTKDMLAQRSVSDILRTIEPKNSKLLSLVAQGTPKDEGGLVVSKGKISKQSATSQRVESFFHLPYAATNTATAVSTLDITFTDVTYMQTRQIWRNTKNGHVGIIDAINTTTGVVSFIAVSATIGFTVAVGNVLLNISNTFEDASSSPASITKNEDQIWNALWEYRYPVEIGWQTKTTKQHAGGDQFMRQKKYKLTTAWKEIERGIIWGMKPDSANTVSMTSLGVNVGASQGIYNYAQTEVSGGGSITPNWLLKEFPRQMHESVGSDDDMIILTSPWVVDGFIEWQQDKNTVEGAGKRDLWGISAASFQTANNVIHFVKHDAFSHGDDIYRGLAIIPEDLRYYHKKDYDFQIYEGIQDNGKHSEKDEISGTAAILPVDGGYSTHALIELG